ncbi:uncharacterized protein BJ212DRAFT_1383636 [Suillus subaureus]|uniref:Uncharacterized protein n=1 Tax=Suillus subaureus TaxID=48587 RepID=A0A9P7E105_9AGAM|nr:uncharacterized protein BJ212DRAFT_1383636 [Suillus subaureus]KAG1808455.1 hypothetical protein BJ212DRAFT_1383636 [Suillus subaureus]
MSLHQAALDELKEVLRCEIKQKQRSSVRSPLRHHSAAARKPGTITTGIVVGKATEFCQPVRQNWLCPVLGRTHAKGEWQNVVEL